MDIRRLYLGSMQVPPVALTHVHGYLVLHPDGLIMIDTGFGATVAGDSEEAAGIRQYEEAQMNWVRRPTPDAVADHGFEPGDVKYVINTHLHDHAGDNYMFPEATFFAQRAEWDARVDSPFRSAWDFPGVKVELLDGDADILPGVRCLFTPGHTLGHQSILVEDGGHKTLFVGDASYFIDFWDDPESVRGSAAEGAQVGVPDGWDIWIESLAKLKSQNADTIHFSHDARILGPARH